MEIWSHVMAKQSVPRHLLTRAQLSRDSEQDEKIDDTTRMQSLDQWILGTGTSVLQLCCKLGLRETSLIFHKLDNMLNSGSDSAVNERTNIV